MPLIAKSTGTTVSNPAPAGAHVARAVRVIDLGTQADNGQFGLKIQPKLMVTFELPNELHVFKPENGEEPYVVSIEWTNSLHEKAGMRKALESWRGRPFTEQELEGFNVGKLAGAACLLNVIHKKKGENTYANIASISPLPKGMVCPPAIQEVLTYDVDMGKNEIYHKLPEWIRKKIDKCENWKPKQEQSAPEEQYEADQTWTSDGASQDPF